MAFLSRLPIGTKLALVMTGLLAIISIAIYVYFPTRLGQQARQAEIEKAAALIEVTAFSIAQAVDDGDLLALSAALTGIRGNQNLSFLVVTDRTGRELYNFGSRIAAEREHKTVQFKPIIPAGSPRDRHESVTVGAFSRDGKLYLTQTPIRNRGKTVGELRFALDLKAVSIQIARSRATVALVTLVTFALAVLAIVAFSTFITRPLRRIAEASEMISEGELERRAEIESGDEVGQLARSFNLMVDRLAGTQLELEELNKTLEQRIDRRTEDLREEFEERRRAETALRESEERYRVLFERNLAGVYIATDDFRVVSCNDACARIFGYETSSEFMAESGQLTYAADNARHAIMKRLREEGAVTNEEVELAARDGSTVWALENIRMVTDEAGGNVFLEGILLDITDRKRAEAEIAFKAYHDALTGLPNRTLFIDRVDMALARAERLGHRSAVFFIDVDDLKAVNDMLGHATGDDLLKLFAERLVSTLRREDTIARIGGDEFLVLLPDITEEGDAAAVATKILARISEPFNLHDDEIFVTPSIGVAVFPEDGADAESLIRNADAAMYRIKESGGNDFRLCSWVGQLSLGRMTLEEEMRKALERDEFEVHYQPQVGIETGLLEGAEALVRWQHPSRALIEPSGFVAVAEHTGLITALGEVVLRKACTQFVAWQRAGLEPATLSVNVSARQFFQRDFPGTIERVLLETGFDPRSLELEITETVAMQKGDHALRMLKRLREAGVSIAIDDFGTGQTSLSYLKNFPFDTVKIDRSFVSEIGKNVSGEAIVRATLLLARNLGLRTVGEGVETDREREFLRFHGCAAIQGYLVSRPLAAGDFEARFLRRPANVTVS